jgi:hypothetical protein
MDRKMLRAVLAVWCIALGGCDVPTAAPRFETTFVMPGEAVLVPVTSRPAAVLGSYDLTDVDVSLINRTRGGALRVDLIGSAGGSGLVELTLAGGGVEVRGVVDLAVGSGQRIPASESEVRALLGQDVAITASGTLCPQTGCDATSLPPFAQVTLRTSLELLLELGGES